MANMKLGGPLDANRYQLSECAIASRKRHAVYPE